MKRREWKGKKMKKEGTYGVQRELEKVRNRERKENAGYRSATQEQRKRTAGLEILYRGFISLTET